MRIRFWDHLTNHDLQRAVREAEGVVRRRLELRPDLEVSALLDAAQVPADLTLRAEALLHELATLLSVSAGRLRHDDILGEIVRVSASDLSIECAEALRAHHLGRHIEVYWYELVWRLQECTNPRVVAEQMKLNVGRHPRGEDGYIELMRGLRLGSFLLLFGPAMRQMRRP